MSPFWIFLILSSITLFAGSFLIIKDQGNFFYQLTLLLGVALFSIAFSQTEEFKTNEYFLQLNRLMIAALFSVLAGGLLGLRFRFKGEQKKKSTPSA